MSAAPVRADLRSYLHDFAVVHPDWFDAELLQLRAFGEARDAEAWSATLDGLRARLDAAIVAGRVGGTTAGAIAGIPDVLEAAWRGEGRDGGTFVLGHLLQITLTDAQWQQFLAASGTPGAGGAPETGGAGPLRLGGFLDAVMIHCLRRQRLALPRALYFQVYERIDALARDAMNRPADFDSWHAALVRLAAHLSLRRLLPKTIGASPGDPPVEVPEPAPEPAPWEHSAAHFDPGPRKDHPLLGLLFSPEEIHHIHRKEAYAAECFAHLYTAIMSGDVSEAAQARVAAEYACRVAVDRLEARQWHARQRAMFEAAPYTSAPPDG